MGKCKIFILAPELTCIGGTELETLITARTFLNSSKCEIILFSTEKISEQLQVITRNWNISYQYYPEWFKRKIIQKFNNLLKKIFKRNGRNYSPLHFFYWYFQTIRNKGAFYYIVTDSAQFYYAPVLVNVDPKRVVLKFTTCFENTFWNMKHKSFLEKCNAILVTSVKQKLFFEKKFRMNNMRVIDVFIWNEERLMEANVQKGDIFSFGMLCRISKIKQLEDGINLVWQLHKEGYNVNLKIKGPPTEELYLEKLQILISDLEAEAIVDLDPEPILPEEASEFYKNISCLLITSLFEGGPNTGLESMAAGVPILSYDIGAMGERLAPFKELLVATNFTTLKEKAVKLILLEDIDYVELGGKIKERYIENYNNEKKMGQTMKLFSGARNF